MIEPRQHGYFKIHNANIYYRIYGTGEKTLFFLHFYAIIVVHANGVSDEFGNVFRSLADTSEKEI